MRIYSIFGGIALLATVAVSSQYFTREYSAVLFKAQPSTSQISRLSNDMIGRPASYRAKLDLLLSCDRIMSGLGFGLLVADTRANISKSCTDLAQDILVTSPDLAYAHYISALAASDTPDGEQFSKGLLASVTYGEFVQWQAERRLTLAMKHYDAAPEVAAVAIQNGVQNTIQYRDGRALLSQLYRKYGQNASPSWEQATLAIEQASPTHQQQFLRDLKASLTN